MFRIYWIALAALGLIGFALPGWAQEAQGLPQVRPEIEEAQPAEVSQAAGRSDQTPLGITNVETLEQADRSAERERNSDQHEASDLDVQIRSANAAERSAATAERQEISAVVQIVLAIAGAFIATVALVHTNCSNRRSERIAKIQVRAYLAFTIKTTEVAKIEGDTARCRVIITGEIQNAGQSPGRAHRILYEIDASEAHPPRKFAADGSDLYEPPPSAIPIASNACVNQSIAKALKVNRGDIISGKLTVRVTYVVKYIDVFDEEIVGPICSGTIVESPDGNGTAFMPDSITAMG